MREVSMAYYWNIQGISQVSTSLHESPPEYLVSYTFIYGVRYRVIFGFPSLSVVLKLRQDKDTSSGTMSFCSLNVSEGLFF